MNNLTRSKWIDPHYLAAVKPHLTALEQGAVNFEKLDLSGVVIGPDASLNKLRLANLQHSKMQQVNLSYAVIATSLNYCQLQQVDFAFARFDYCSLTSGQLLGCNFYHGQLIVNLDDAKFTDCVFDSATIKSGMRGLEFGGRRATFINCDFTHTNFDRIALRASRFINCSFYQSKFIACDLRGMKLEGGTGIEKTQFKAMPVPDWAK